LNENISLKKVLKFIYKKVKSEDKPFLAVKNCQLEKVLKKLQVPFINLDILR